MSRASSPRMPGAGRSSKGWTPRRRRCRRRIGIACSRASGRPRSAPEPRPGRWRWLRPAIAASALAAVALAVWTWRDPAPPSPVPSSDRTRDAVSAPPPVPAVSLRLDKPEMTLSAAALTWRGATAGNQLLADLKPPFDAFRQGDYARADRGIRHARTTVSVGRRGLLLWRRRAAVLERRSARARVAGDGGKAGRHGIRTRRRVVSRHRRAPHGASGRRPRAARHLVPRHQPARTARL